MELLFFIGRLLYGGFFLKSGIDHFRHLHNYSLYAHAKGVPLPRLAVIGTGVMLAVGGLGIILGVHIKFSIFLIALFLLSTLYKMHAFWLETDPQKVAMEKIQFMKNVALLGAALMFLSVLEPWAYSI